MFYINFAIKAVLLGVLAAYEQSIPFLVSTLVCAAAAAGFYHYGK